MTSLPGRFWIQIPPTVREQLIQAPEWVRVNFHALTVELEAGAYPGQHPHVAPAKGTDRRNTFVAWKGGVHVLYKITRDQPAVLVIGVHWRAGPGGGNDGGEPYLDASAFSLAA